MASISSRLDPLSPKFVHSISLHFPEPRSNPSPQLLTVFPFRVEINSFASSTFKTQNSCWMEWAVVPFPTASLRMGVSSRLPRGAVYRSGSMLPVVTPRGRNSSVGACSILFNSHQLHRQSWAVPMIVSRCGVYTNSPLPPRPTSLRAWDSPALVLASQLPTSQRISSQSSTSLHNPLSSSSIRIWT